MCSLLHHLFFPCTSVWSSLGFCSCGLPLPLRAKVSQALLDQINVFSRKQVHEFGLALCWCFLKFQEIWLVCLYFVLFACEVFFLLVFVCGGFFLHQIILFGSLKCLGLLQPDGKPQESEFYCEHSQILEEVESAACGVANEEVNLSKRSFSRLF